jgi:tRNA A-37 threonylcarbamoyl transferase component Bud32
MSDHPSPEKLQELLNGKLDDAERRSIEAHVQVCEPCQQRLNQLTDAAEVVRSPHPDAQPPEPPADPAFLERLARQPPQTPRDLSGPPTISMEAPFQPDWSKAATFPPFSSLPCDFGRFRVQDCLGQGGMATVFRAHDNKLDRTVALKIPHFRAEDGRQVIERFLQEARAAGGLDHAGICRTLDCGEIGSCSYLALDYIDAKPLSRLLHDGQPLEQRRAAEVVLQVARALSAAHFKGVTHRDLKPGNLLVTADGRCKVVDFGLAQRQPAPDGTVGVITGTPPYLSPEQARGEPTDQRTDTYSLGAVFYYLLTGQPPFAYGKGLLEDLRTILQGAPIPPAKARPGLDARLDAICRKAMAKDPANRYATMQEFAAALQAYLEPGAFSRLWLAVAAGVLLAIGGLTGAWLLGRNGKDSDPARAVGAPGTKGAGEANSLKGYLDVWVTEKGNPRRERLMLHQAGALPLRPGDMLEYEASVNRPAYLYVVYLDTRGKATPLFPWKDYDWKQRPAEERRMLKVDTGELGKSPAGIESLLLLVREEPLPKEVDLPALFAGLPKQKGLPDPRARAWFVNGELRGHDPDRGPPVRIGQGDPREDVALQTQVLLRDKLRPLFPYTRAVCFAFQGD